MNKQATSQSYQLLNFDYLAADSQQTHSQMEVSIWRAMDQEVITDEEGQGTQDDGDLQQVHDTSQNQGTGNLAEQKYSGKPSFHTEASSNYCGELQEGPGAEEEMTIDEEGFQDVEENRGQVKTY